MNDSVDLLMDIFVDRSKVARSGGFRSGDVSFRFDRSGDFAVECLYWYIVRNVFVSVLCVVRKCQLVFGEMSMYGAA